jgi:hypothetical protein
MVARYLKHKEQAYPWTKQNIIILYPIIATNTQAWWNLTLGLLSKQEQRNDNSQKKMSCLSCRASVLVSKIYCGMKPQILSSIKTIFDSLSLSSFIAFAL